MELHRYLSAYGIELCGVLPLCDCELRKPYLLEQAGFALDRIEHLRVLIFAIPYYSHAADDPTRNVSAYATAEDYHVFVKELFDDLLPRLRTDFKGYSFAGFADHSPIDEILAAVDAGLGVRGKNGLLLTERYSSYVFLAEMVTDLPLTLTPSPLPQGLRVCHGCDLCRRACPMQPGELCRSALTQKKSPLTAQEEATLKAFPCVWGCDICQEVCPYTARARQRNTLYSPIPFFEQNTLPHLTCESLDQMSEADFARRAFAWRGRQTIRRNLLLKEQQNERQGKE